MGILPPNISLYDNSNNDPAYELKRQLSARKAQLDILNSREALSDDQLQKKKDLEQTVSMLSNKIDKKTGIITPSIPEEGIVIPKSSSGISPCKNIYSNVAPKQPDSYLKGFFFDARI